MKQFGRIVENMPDEMEELLYIIILALADAMVKEFQLNAINRAAEKSGVVF